MGQLRVAKNAAPTLITRADYDADNTLRPDDDDVVRTNDRVTPPHRLR